MNREESKVTHIVKIPRETIDCAKCKHCGEQTCVPYGFSCQYEPIIPRSNVRISQKQINDINKIFKQLQQENYSLKKQLEENKHKGLYNTCLPYSTGYNKAIKEKENQQKCFIEYLEEQIKDMEEEIGNSITKPYKESHIIRKNVYQEILSKYKEIIGGRLNVSY